MWKVDTVPKFIRKLAVFGVLIVAGYWVIFGCMIFSSPLHYSEMDFNHDGVVSFSEADYASSFGEKEFTVNRRKCVEYFAYKDGLSLKTVCK